MVVVKKKGNKTYKGKDGNEHNYINYYLELDNGKRIAIRTVNASDLKVLAGVAVYERSKND